MPSSRRREFSARGPVRLAIMVFLNLLMMAGLLGAAPAAMAVEDPATPKAAGDTPKAPQSATHYPDLPADAPGPVPTMAAPADNKKPAPLPADLAEIDARKPRPALTNPGGGDELTEKRTATSKTFAGTKPGEFKTEIHSEPVHFKDSSGQWKDIDTSLGPVKDGVRRNRSNAFDLELAETAGGEALATVAIDSSHSVGFALEGAAKVKANATNNGVTYPKASKDTDVRLTSRPGGVKEELILSGPGAPDRFVFPLNLKGLTAAMDGVDVVYRDSKGVERARTNRGYMYDSKVDPRSDEPAFSEGVTYRLIAHGGGTALEVRLDRAWLDSPERVWPVTVDPEVHINYNWDDTYVMSPYSTNYTGDPELKVGTFNGGGNVARAFMHFGTAEFTYSNVTMAYLYAYEKHSFNCGVNPGGAFRVLDSNWNPSTTVSMPGPAIDGNGVGGVWSGTTCHDRVAYWDIKGMAQHWSNAGTTNGSVSLRAWNEANSHEWKKYDSANTATAPFIAVWYNRPPHQVGELTPSHNSVRFVPEVSLGGRYSDPQGNAGSIAFYVYRRSNNELAWVGWSPQVNSGQMAYATTTALSDDNYYVRALAYDGQDISSWSADHHFFVDTQKPSITAPSPTAGAVVGSPFPVSAVYHEPHGRAGQVLFALNRVTDGLTVASAWGNYVSPGQTATASLSITPPGQYDFYVIANDGGGDGNAYGLPWNGPHRITVAATPGAPTNLTAQSDPSVARVTWNPPANNGGGTITDYLVTATNGGTTQQFHCNTPACLASPVAWFTGLAQGATTFVTKAFNVAGPGPTASIASTMPSLDLLKPTGVSATRGDQKATVQWTPPTLNLPLLSTYTVKTYTDSGQPLAQSASTANATAEVTGLQNGQPVKFKVEAAIQVPVLGSLLPTAISDFSNTVTPAGLPSPPTNIGTTPQNGQVLVTWTASNDNGAPILSYLVLPIRGSEALEDKSKTVGGAVTAATITGLSNGVAYNFKVVATNAIGSSDESGPTDPTQPQGEPSAPINVVATAGENKATVTWGAANPNGATVHTYSVEAAPGGSRQVTDGSGRSLTFSGLTGGTEYMFTVTATNAVGDSPAVESNVVAPVDPLPGSPGGVEAEALDIDSVEVSWLAAAGLVASYRITGSEPGVVVDVPSSARSVELDNLQRGRDYTFQVVAINSGGASAPATSSVVRPSKDPDSSTLVSLGDSFTSGEGNPLFEENSIENGCHRSKLSAYAIIAGGPEGLDLSPDKVKNLACSAQGPRAITGSPGVTFREEPQLSQMLALPEEPRNIALTSGINVLNDDYNEAESLSFGDIIIDCVVQGVLRSVPGDAVDSCQTTLSGEVDDSLDDLGARMKGVYSEIQAKAPSANIYVLGYPSLFSRTREDFGCQGIRPSDVAWINDKEDEANRILQDAIEELRQQDPKRFHIEFVDLRNAFNGHELCTDGTYLNPIDSGSPGRFAYLWALGGPVAEFEDLYRNLQNAVYFFHPNREGHAKMAQCLVRAVTNLGPCQSDPLVLGGPEVTLENAVAAPGSSFTVRGSGFAPDSEITMSLDSWSSRVMLGNLVVGSGGAFEEQVSIPSSVPSGAHKLFVSGINPDGQNFGQQLNLTITGTP